MKNIKLLKAHCEKVYNQRIKQAKRAKFRLDGRGLRVEMTPAGLKAEIRKLEKRKAAALARIDAATVDSIKAARITVDWKKSRYWGNCPTAEVEIWTAGGQYFNATGRASGCGYDKESAAIAQALGGLAAFDNLIFDNFRKAKNTGQPFYFRKCDALPFLEISGCGVGVLAQWVKMSGYKWTEQHGKKWDFYEFEK